MLRVKFQVLDIFIMVHDGKQYGFLTISHILLKKTAYRAGRIQVQGTLKIDVFLTC